jgi:protein disulfide-isomerase
MTAESHPIDPRRPNPFRPVLVVFIVFAAVGAVVAASKFFAPKELVPWQSDLAAARRQATVTNKPVLAYFTAEWCGPCQQMRRAVFTDRAVAAAAQKVLPVRIDIDRQPAVARQFHIDAVPTFVLLDPNGNVLRAESGAMDAEQFVEWLSGK